MRNIRFTSVGLLATLVLGFSISHAQTAGSQHAPTALEMPIHHCEKQVALWQRTEWLELGFIVATLALGATISALQALKSDAAKNTTIVLGILTAILTGVNGSVFPADVKTLRRAVTEGGNDVDQLWLKVQAAQDDKLSAKDHKAANDDYEAQLNKFYALATSIAGSSAGALPATPAPTPTPDKTGMITLLPVVYANSSSKLPDWASQPPANTETAIYSVGKATDPSLAIAKQNSADAALYNAALALVPAAPTASRSALLDLIKSSAVTQDSAFDYDGKTKSYDYYTLLRLTPAVEDIVKTLPASATLAPTVFQANGLQPSDLTFNTASGLFVLDTAGWVSKLLPDAQNGAQIEKVFRVRNVEGSIALTATNDTIFVAASAAAGCTVYRYTFADKALVPLVIAVRQICGGVATDGTAIYVSVPDRKEIIHCDKWNVKSCHSWSVGESAPGYVAFDNLEHRLIFADSSGNAYAISLPDGKQHFLVSNLGAVQSIAVSRFHILFASGKKVLFVARSDSHGENPPLGWPELPGGHVVGLAVDGSDNLWLADYDNRLIKGPFTLI
jgi:hypothetical protein